MKFNTKVKIYPDGNYIATTANRPFFMTPQTRLALKEQKRLERLEYMENSTKYKASYDKLKSTLYDDGVYHDEFKKSLILPASSVSDFPDIVYDLLDKAKISGIPINGITYLTSDGKAPKKQNIRRARDKLFDLIYLNQFDYFATFTFNPRKKDSFDVKAVMKTVKKWLDNHQQRNDLQYVMVPEYHKSGRIHLHMLYSGNLTLKSSGKWTKSGKPIYNCKSWRYGFSTVIPTDDNRAKLAFYVSKYITKDVQKIFGKYYYSSQGLIREAPVEYGDRFFSDVKTPFIHVDAIDIKFKYESSIKFNSDAMANSDAILDALGLSEV